MREFWERGYRVTSIDDLVEATGVRPGSLYHAFPGGKRGLFLQALDRYSRLVVPEKLGALESQGAGVPELRAYFDGIVDDLTTREGRMGCLMVNSAMELATEESASALASSCTRCLNARRPAAACTRRPAWPGRRRRAPARFLARLRARGPVLTAP